MLDGLREDAARWGWIRALFIRVMERLQPVLHLAAVQIRPLSEPIARSTLPEQFSVRIASLEDLERAVDDPKLDLSADFVCEALAREDFCSAVFELDRMIAYSWHALGPTPHGDDLYVEFDPPAGYSYKAFTHPDYRGRRLQNAVALEARDRLLRAGRTEVVSFVDCHNMASIASSGHRPNEVVGYAGYLVVLRTVIPFRSRGARRNGFRFVPRRDPKSD